MILFNKSSKPKASWKKKKYGHYNELKSSKKTSEYHQLTFQLIHDIPELLFDRGKIIFQ